jgi:hypothetical protein
MNEVDAIKRLLRRCSARQREDIFRHLRVEFSMHPLEGEWHTKAEVILEAIYRASEITRRNIKGVLAEAAFRVEVVERLENWQNLPFSGNQPYDFLLDDGKGTVRVQVKLQRSKGGQPWPAQLARKSFRLLPPDMFIVETQKTRGGKTKKEGTETRPYRFGEFDLLAVAMNPSTKTWDAFIYTVAAWLFPDPRDQALIFKYQPVASAPNVDWTNSFETAVQWLRSGAKKTIRTQ